MTNKRFNLKLYKLYFILIKFYLVSSNEIMTKSTNFTAIWNVPTFLCEDKYGVTFNVSQYGIKENHGDAFQGNIITIFYQNQLGLYPRIDRQGTFVNGGLPQLADLHSHLNKVASDLDLLLPYANFSGLAVIDWEAWRPIFIRNDFNKHQKIYVYQSEAIVRQQHPDWSNEKVRKKAESDFEFAARNFMQKTLVLCRQLRPHGKWGFYGFPSCYNYQPGQKSCSPTIVAENDRLAWMFKSSSAILPSIYLEENFGSHEDRYWHVRGELEESLRVRGHYAVSDTPILPYTRYLYGDTAEFYDLYDLNTTIRQPFNIGLKGVVFWGASGDLETKLQCQSLKSYVANTLGPYIENFTKAKRTPANSGHKERYGNVNSVKDMISPQDNEAKDVNSTQVNEAKNLITPEDNEAKDVIFTQVNEAKDLISTQVNEAKDLISTQDNVDLKTPKAKGTSNWMYLLMIQLFDFLCQGW